jgi:hypothetical protein
MLGRLLPPVFRHAVKPALAILLGLAATTSLMFANGEPGARFKAYDPNALMQRRNLLLWSEDFTNAVWPKAQGGTATIPVVTSNAGLSPEGLLEADRVQFALNGGTALSDLSFVQFGGSLGLTGATWSIYAKSYSGTPYTMYFRAEGVVQAVAVGAEWTRIEVPNPGSVNYVQVGIRGNNYGGVTNSQTADVLLWGAQLEKGLVATAYQKVTDWVTEYLGGEPLKRRNLFAQSVWPGAGTGVLPSGWGATGSQAAAPVSVAQETVNGGSTGVVKIRRISGASGFEGLQSNSVTGMLKGGAAHTASVLVRVPTGVTAAQLLLWDGVASYNLVAAATLNAQPKDVWVAYTASFTPAADRSLLGFGANVAATGAGFDLALPQVELGSFATAYQPITDWTSEFAADEARRLAIRSKITMWQDNLGVTPVTKVEDPVGLWLDVKRGTTVERGPELISNGTFDSATTGWTANGTTLSIDAGRLKAVTTNTGDSGAYQDIATVPGAVYEALCSVDNAAATAGAGIRVTTTAYADTALSNNIAAGASGQARLIFRATAWTMRISLDRRAASAVTGDIAYFDNVSVREVGYARGAELVTNGAFNSGTTGWTASGAALSVASGELTVTGSASTDRATQTITSLIVGRSYELTGDVISGTANPVITAWAMPGFSTNLGTTSGTGQKRLIFTATTTQIELWLRVNAGTGVFDNVSVREIPTEFGAELVTNGGFDSASNWTLAASASISGGKLSITSGDTGALATHTTATVTSGTTYRVQFTVDAISAAGGGVSIRIGGTLGAAISAPGTYTEYIVAGATGVVLMNGRGVGVASATIDNVSVREIVASAPKNASQPTAINRPKLDALVNKLVNTEGSGLTTGSTNWLGTNMSGTLQADGSSLVARVSTSASAYASQALGTAMAVGTQFVARIQAKKATIGNMYGLRVSGAYPDRADAVINLDTGEVITAQGGGAFAGSVTAASEGPDADGFYTLTMRGTVLGTAAVTFIHGPAVGAGGGWEAVSATLLNAYARKPDLRTAADATLNIPAYQRVNSATDYDTAGFPHRVKANGTNQWMVTPVIDFTGTDKLTVIAGVNVASDNGQAQVLSEFSTDSSLNPAFNLNIQGATDTFAARSTGTISSTAATPGASVVAPQNMVLGMSSSIATDSLVLRMNGAQLAASAGDQGSGNFGAFPLYLFSRNGSSLFFNGGLSEYVLRGAATDTATLARAERELARDAKVVM